MPDKKLVSRIAYFDGANQSDASVLVYREGNDTELVVTLRVDGDVSTWLPHEAVLRIITALQEAVSESE